MRGGLERNRGLKLLTVPLGLEPAFILEITLKQRKKILHPKSLLIQISPTKPLIAYSIYMAQGPCGPTWDTKIISSFSLELDPIG